MIRTQTYCVGGHCFALAMLATDALWQQMVAYRPFCCKSAEEVIFTLHIRTPKEWQEHQEHPLVETHDEGITFMAASTSEGGSVFRFHLFGDLCCKLYVSEDGKHAEACLTHQRMFGLDNALMLLYCISAACRDTLLLHASVTTVDDKGYLFLGKSGTGKSTHTALWIKHIPGAELLNDDNPVVRMAGNKALVFGSPWSGKTPCYHNRQATVAAFVRLHQAPHNHIARLSSISAYAALMPSASAVRWYPRLAAGIHHTLEQLVSAVPVFRLDCLPDEEAAHICFDTITRTAL